MTTTIRRLSRKAHRCDSCLSRIEPGWVYLSHVAFPGDVVDRISRMKECADCAGRYGRDHLLGRMPDSQPYRYWLADERPQPPDPLDGAA